MNTQERTGAQTHTGSPLKVFIVEDDGMAAATLKADLQRTDGIGEVHVFASYEESTLRLLEQHPDIIFLGTETCATSGATFCETVRRHINFTVKPIFYPSRETAGSLGDISGAAVLPKQYTAAEFACVMDKTINDEGFEVFSKALTRHDGTTHKHAIQTVNELLLLAIDELLLLRYNKEARAWILSLTDGNTYKLRQSVKADDILALHTDLVRLSSNCIVNIGHVAAIENTSLRCKFKPPFDTLEIYASRRSFSKIKEKLELL